MKKWMAFLLALLMLALPALAEVPERVQVEENVYRLTVEETGEVLLLTVDAEGNPLRLETEVPAQVEAAAFP